MDTDVLIEYLNGHLTPEAKLAVESWIQADPGNEAEFRKLQNIWAAGSLSPEPPDTDQAWLQVRQSIRVEKGNRQVFRLGLRIAAAIAVLLIGCWLWLEMRPAPMITASRAAGSTASEVSLPDGSKVWLNRNSTLRYPKTFKAGERIVELEGEAFFEVSRDESRPFLVQTASTTTKVLGTSFDIMAYPDSTRSWIQVISGKVAFSAKDLPGALTMLEKGQSAIVEHGRLHNLDIKALNPNALAWKTRIFIFDDQPLSAVIQALGSVFDSKIQLNNPKLADCRLNGTYREESLEAILNSITLLLGLEMSRTGRVVTLSGTSC